MMILHHYALTAVIKHKEQEVVMFVVHVARLQVVAK
jgi:hypothetical protein